MTYPLSEIDGLPTFAAAKLKSLGIRTTDRLLEAARTVKGRKALAAKTGISEQHLLAWANFSDYMRIPGMGKAKVGLMRAAGVATVRELALRNPARLAQNMKEVNIKRKLVRVLPSERSVEQLIDKARKLQPKITYWPVLRARSPFTPRARKGARRCFRRLDLPAGTAQSDPMIAISPTHVTASTSAHRPGWQAVLSRPFPAVMGVLNITPDSFSDGGQFMAPDRALAQARRMIAEGADMIDIGAESTRPYGAEPVSADEELKRLQPILAAIVSLGVPVSIDSMKSAVVAWALDAGAKIVNDVWGLQRDPDMARLLAGRGCPLVIMHNRDRAEDGVDIMRDISEFFARSLEIAAKAGISRENIVLDPGIGFGKTPEQSMMTIARLDQLRTFGLPLLVGASRKRFISSVSPSEPHQRLGGSIAAHLIAAKGGARIIRTHDVYETVQALRVAEAVWEKA
jgi:dihydropteroate synthase